MKCSRRSGVAATGIIVVIGFLAMAASAYWLQRAYLSQPVKPDYFMQDPGAISLYSMPNGQTVPQRFTFSGKANAQWFFFGGMSAKLLRADGKELAETTAVEIGDDEEIVPNLVPFAVDFDAGKYVGPAQIVIRRRNPLDDPTYDKEYRIRVFISSTSTESIIGD